MLRKPKSQVKSLWLKVRISEIEKHQLEQSAIENDCTISDDIRKRLSLSFYLDSVDPHWAIRAEIKRLQSQLPV